MRRTYRSGACTALFLALMTTTTFAQERRSPELIGVRLGRPDVMPSATKQVLPELTADAGQTLPTPSTSKPS
jgi:hypothetical protein